MFEVNEQYHFVIYIGAILTLFFLLSSLSIRKKNKKVTLDNEAKKETLLKTPIIKILEQLDNDIKSTQEKIDAGQAPFKTLEKQLDKSDNNLTFINSGILPPVFKFDNSEDLKANIKKAQKAQYALIKNDKATTAYSHWEWFGSASKGNEMVNSYRTLLLKAFNAEFDLIRKKMKYSTYDTAFNKLHRLSDQLSKLGETAKVTISTEYLNLKTKELDIWHDELEHKEDLKLEIKEQQSLLREQSKLAKGEDIDEIKDSLYYKNSDLIKAKKIAESLHGGEAEYTNQEILKMQKEIAKLESKFERAKSQAQLTKAGYVYVISNIGSFGEGVVKIGMTRRLEPMDRVTELGDASVPFKFDVHTLAFVDNAPKLENQLHKLFNEKRVNLENHRKEFFRVPPEEVRDAMDDLSVDSDWFFDVEAKEYRESILMRQAIFETKSDVEFVAEQLPTTI
jgi:hypothetical protein